MEEEFSAEAMRGISSQAAATNMREKYKKVVELINAAAQRGEIEIVINRKTIEFSYELFEWLTGLGFRLTYIRPGYNIKSNVWDNLDSISNYIYAHWVRIAW